MATIVTRSGKGSPLTHAEVDSNFTNLNTDKLELSGGTMTGNLSFGDNDKAIFGAGSDLQIYHSGSHSIIKDAGTGNLGLLGDNLRLGTADWSNNYLAADNGGAVTLYYNGSSKLATTSTGIDVTGTVTADGLTVDGVANFNANNINYTGSSPRINFFENDATDQNTSLINTVGDFIVRTVNDAATTTTDRIRLDHSTGDISFYEDTGTTAKFFWDASAESLGIGTSSPNQNLQVKSGSGGGLTLQANTATQNEYSQLGFVPSTNDAANPNAYIRGLRGATSTATFLTFGTTNLERMRIDSSGNVGIGTSSSGYTGFADNLTIADSSNGGLTIRTGASAQGAIYFSDTTGDVAGQYAGFLVYNQSGNHMAFGTSSTERMRIDSSGNVGIGTSSPASALHVNNSGTGSSDHAYAYFTTGDTGSTASDGLTVGYAAGNIAVVTNREDTALSLSTGNSNILFNTNGSEAMRIDSSGRVGIGTSDPSSNTSPYYDDLVIKNATSGTGAGITIQSNSTNGFGAVDFRKADGSQVGKVYASSAGGQLAFETGGSERMRITSSGSVGIGTTSPDSLLELEASAGARLRLTDTGTQSYTIGNTGTSFNIYNESQASEAMRIDSSGNLLVGKTSIGTSTDGFEARAGGITGVSDTSSAALYVNRNGSDGDMVIFQKVGTTVGSIGSSSIGGLEITGNNSSRSLLLTTNFMPANGSGAKNDGVIDLGVSDARWKDLYLSGGVYLGGTGSANKLDDYEEGTWTPAIYQGITSPTFTQQHGFYRKVGSLVYADFYLLFSGGTGSSVITKISGLPFNQASGYYRGGGTSSYSDIIGNTLQFYGDNGTDRFGIYHSGSGQLSFSTSVASKYIIGTFIYIAA